MTSHKKYREDIFSEEKKTICFSQLVMIANSRNLESFPTIFTAIIYFVEDFL